MKDIIIKTASLAVGVTVGMLASDAVTSARRTIREKLNERKAEA